MACEGVLFTVKTDQNQMMIRKKSMPESVRTALAIAIGTSAGVPRTLLSIQRSAVKQLQWLAKLSDDQAGWSDAQFRASSVKMLSICR